MSGSYRGGLSLKTVASIVGVVLVSKADREITPKTAQEGVGPLLLARDFSAKVPRHALLGDILAITSSLCYAIYTLLLKVSMRGPLI